MTIAVNDAGDVLSLQDGAWKPAVRAVNDKTGESLVLDDGAWKPLPAPKQAEPPHMADAGQLEAPTEPPPASSAGKQGQGAAYVNAAAQGPIESTGGIIAGTGRAIKAGDISDAHQMLGAMDLVDQGQPTKAYLGLSETQRGLLANYRRASPDDQATQRAALQQTLADAETPNAVTNAGEAVKKFGTEAFPVEPGNEGTGTNIVRSVTGVLPMAAAAAVGGPAGVLGAMTAIGAQTYDSTYQEAISKGATHEQADDAAGKSAVASALTMAVPVGHLIRRVPMPLRDGFMKTLFNLGQNGVEFGSFNALNKFTQNYVARETFDPNRPYFQGAGEAALEGAAAGLIIPATVGAARTGIEAARTPEQGAADVMAAPSVDAAIEAARKAVSGPGTASDAAQLAAMQGIRPELPPVPGQFPAFVPPGTEVPAAQRLGAIMAADQNLMANRPAEIPPGTPRPPVPWEAGGPATVPSWGDLFAAGKVAANDESPFQSVGAAASREQTPQSQIDLSPADMKANRRQAEKAQILAPPERNDNTIYVPGSFPTLAERSGDPETAQQEVMLRQRNPNAFESENGILTRNMAARVKLYDDLTPSDTALDAMRDQRGQQWRTDTQSILPNAKPADLTQVADWVSHQLANPRTQERDAVRGVLESFQNKLYDENGELKTDPASVWGIHDDLQDKLAKAKDPLNATGAEKFAFNELNDAKQRIDDALNTATNNQFQTALDNFATASQAINAGEILRANRDKLTNAKGDILAQRFHNFVLGLAEARGRPGIDPAMNISDDTMHALIDIDHDLKRAGLIDLGKARGSPTNLYGALAEKMGLNVAQRLVGSIPGAGPLLSVGTDLLNERRIKQMTERHLAPPEGGYVYREDHPATP